MFVVVGMCSSLCVCYMVFGARGVCCIWCLGHVV